MTYPSSLMHYDFKPLESIASNICAKQTWHFPKCVSELNRVCKCGTAVCTASILAFSFHADGRAMDAWTGRLPTCQTKLRLKLEMFKVIPTMIDSKPNTMYTARAEFTRRAIRRVTQSEWSSYLTIVKKREVNFFHLYFTTAYSLTAIAVLF